MPPKNSEKLATSSEVESEGILDKLAINSYTVAIAIQ